jgi:hypothetical protein
VKVFSETLVPNSRDEFEKWIDRNPSGFVISRRSKDDAMIHQGRCGHFKHSDRSASLTANPKICSTDRRELETW